MASSASSSKVPDLRKIKCFVLVSGILIVLACSSLFFDEELIIVFGQHAFGKQTKTSSSVKKVDNRTSSPFSSPVSSSRTVTDLIESVMSAKQKKEEQVRIDYGEYFDILFNPQALEKTLEISETSLERLYNKLLIKILSAQLISDNDETTKKTFVWSTGGHSAAAGHGNLFSQSYTAVLEDTVKDVFQSIGIEFEARNHAMGGYSSAPEVACCNEAIYGSDTDILSWDFGMTDGRAPDNMNLWTNRAGLISSSTLPFIVYLTRAWSYGYENFVTFGFGVGEFKGIGDLIKQLPDFQVETMDDAPKGIKYLNCGGYFESQGTICGENKWATKDYCESAKYQTSWHSGWKSHMYVGRVLGLALIEKLVEALKMLDDDTTDFDNTTYPGVTMEYLKYLESKDKANYDKFTSSTPKLFGFKNLANYMGSEHLFYRGKSICHTAILPSMARYQNLSLTRDQNLFQEMISPTREYDIYSSNALRPLPSSSSSINSTKPLYIVYDPYQIQKCDTLLEIDYKDYFMVRNKEGSAFTKIPSDKELKSSQSSYSGMIMICQPNCPWNKCPKGFIYLNSDDWNKFDELDITVNGKAVSQVSEIGKFCYVLVNDDGSVFWRNESSASDNVQYELTFRVNKANYNFQISSIVLW